MTFQQKYDSIVKKNNSLVCVGLDSDLEKIPKHLKKKRHPLFVFNKAIIDATSDLVCAYKPNTAFYEAYGIQGLTSLKKTIKYLQENYPTIPIILDAKRGDIGNTALMYAKSVFEYWDVDATTLTIFTGFDGIEPFLKYKDRFSFLYLRSSNPGAGDFQDIKVNKKPFFQLMAEKVKQWNEPNFGIIAAATYPDELKLLRGVFPDRLFLVPGVGAQKGFIAKTVQYGIDKEKTNLIISLSRAIIYASSSHDFAQAARHETEKIRSVINKYRYG